MEKNKVTLTKKLFIVPTVIFIISLLLSSFLLNIVVKKNIVNIYQDNFLSVTNDHGETISFNHQMVNERIEHLNRHLLNAMDTVIESRDVLSNDYLTEIKDYLLVDDLFWSSPDGIPIYGTKPDLIGTQPTPGDPIDVFIKSGKSFFYEGIRKGTVNDIYILTAYKKDSDGYFAQAIINADFVMEFTASHAPEKVIKRIYDSNVNSRYTILYNPDLSINHTYPNQSALTFNPDSLNALNDQGFSSSYRFSNHFKEEIFEITVPVIDEDNNIIYYLKIGFSFNDYLNIHNQIMSILMVIGLFILTVYFIFDFLYVLKPISNLESSISSFNVSSGTYLKQKKIPNAFLNIYKQLDRLGVKIDDSNKELSLLHDKLTNQALNDYLTNLPNRLSLNSEINHYIKNKTDFSLLFLDINNFKVYNDTKGHVFGDLLLKEISKTFLNIFSKKFFVSRFGGDEFVVLAKGNDSKKLKKLIKEIYQEFSEPLLINGFECPIDISIGVSNYPKDGLDANTLIRKADLAMYAAKEEGANYYKFYQAFLDESLEKETNVLDTLREAIKNKGFYILLQPQVNIHTNKIVAYEALARIKAHNIPANTFILIAEKNNLISDIGYLIFEETLKAFNELKKNKLPLLPIYINISSRQFYDKRLIDYIWIKLIENKLDPSLIGLEITESGIINNEEIAIEFINKAKSYGFKISLDDFGTGNASINKLLTQELNQVKLDRSFINTYLNEKSFQVFNAVVELAKLLKYEVIAEGVETKDKIELLKKTRCDIVQGYYYYRPISLNEIIKLSKEINK